jgi:tripartite-type tricarboxylate transporter receptor subunit TctC
MKKGKALFTLICAILFVGSLFLSPVSAFPTKPITLIVAFSAGGSTDVAARTMGLYLEKYLGQPIVVKNYPGAGGQIGWTKLAMAKPDGHTIGFINMPALQMVKAARENVAYDPVKSFAAIGCNINDPNTVLVRKDDDRFKTLKDLIEYAKKNPGKVVCGADGPLSDDQLAMVKMGKATGAKFSYVAYSGSAKAHAALLGKHADFTVTNTFDVIKYKDKERCLVQFWKERYYMNPDTPTFKEIYGKEIIGSSTRAFAAPVKVPADRLAVLRDAFKKAANDPEYLERAKKIGLTLSWLDHKELAEFIKNLNDNVQELIGELK